jgi:hypothetical protein
MCVGRRARKSVDTRCGQHLMQKRRRQDDITQRVRIRSGRVSARVQRLLKQLNIAATQADKHPRKDEAQQMRTALTWYTTSKLSLSVSAEICPRYSCRMSTNVRRNANTYSGSTTREHKHRPKSIGISAYWFTENAATHCLRSRDTRTAGPRA